MIRFIACVQSTESAIFNSPTNVAIIERRKLNLNPSLLVYWQVAFFATIWNWKYFSIFKKWKIIEFKKRIILFYLFFYYFFFTITFYAFFPLNYFSFLLCFLFIIFLCLPFSVISFTVKCMRHCKSAMTRKDNWRICSCFILEIDCALSRDSGEYIDCLCPRIIVITNKPILRKCQRAIFELGLIPQGVF